MLGEKVVVNVDDLRNTDRAAARETDTRYLPRKLSRFKRAMKVAGLTRETDAIRRSEWMLQTISQSNASLVFVHFLDFATQFLDVWERLDIPVVIHCHGYDITWDVRHHVTGVPIHPDGYQDRVRSLPENVWFIANSTHTQRQLHKRNIHPDKIFLKRFGVPLASNPRRIAANESPQILFLGRLVDFKGPLETIRAFAPVSKLHPASKLNMAGGGGLSPDMDRLVRDLGIQNSTICHGVVTQDRGKELREQSAIFTAHNQTGAMTRQVEAFGVSMLEAMGEGIPVVTGRSGGIPDFIKHGENGLLFEPGEIDSHSEMLDRLLSSTNLRNSLGRAAWETVRDHYQPHHEQADLHRIFDHVCLAGTHPTLDESSVRAA